MRSGRAQHHQRGQQQEQDPGQPPLLKCRCSHRLQVSIGDGPGRGMAWGCDLSYDYVKVRGQGRAGQAVVEAGRQAGSCTISVQVWATILRLLCRS